ncbi:hypothetical protein KSF78_0008977 [Schistosoma japonicum]|nr:hypothetical protein KSF78_0008977 [Schistosoma japonicum]
MSTASSSSFSLLYISVLLLVLIHSSIQEDDPIKTLENEINDAKSGIMLENPNNTENIRKCMCNNTVVN